MRKRVIFFGLYDPDYARTKVLERGFIANGFIVTQCHVDPRKRGRFRKYIELWRLGKAIRADAEDLVLVCYPGHTVVWLARMLFRNRIVFDAFVSLYDSNVYDRALYGPRSWKGIRDFVLDRVSCHFARSVLIDTAAHARYFTDTLGVPFQKMIVVHIGADLGVFDRHSKEGIQPPLSVSFHGTYIPLHGISVILKAAQLLKNDPVQFRLIGGGQEYKDARDFADQLSLTNVTFIPKVPISTVAEYVAEAHVCLGIFGTTPKTLRVVPNKVYECAAAGKAIITADSPAIREVFTEDLNILLVPPGDPASLASAIQRLCDDTLFRSSLGMQARALIRERLTPEAIVSQLLIDLKARGVVFGR